jgi:hypothetical protein
MVQSAPLRSECQHCLARAQKPHVRLWHGLVSLDLTKPPVPVLRWIGIALTGIIFVAAGAPTRMGDWLWAAIIGGVLLLPDVAGFGVGGVRVDLRKTQEEVATLRNEVNAKSSAVANINITPEVFQNAVRTSFAVMQAEQTPAVPFVPIKPEEGEGYVFG